MPMPQKSNLSDIKSFVVAQRWGTLSTLSQSKQGYPFGSIVPYDIDPAGNICIYISLIAEHFKNLKAHPQASLTIIDPFGVEDPQAHARATLLLIFEAVPDSERETAQKSYEARFPNSINYEIAHNFLFMRGIPQGLRWIGGFGDIQWIEREDFISTPADILAYDAWEVLTHMNQDHQDALCDFVKAHFESTSNVYAPKMVSLNSTTFKIRHGRNAEHEVDIPFTTPIAKPEQVRQVMIETLKKVRAVKV